MKINYEMFLLPLDINFFSNTTFDYTRSRLVKLFIVDNLEQIYQFHFFIAVQQERKCILQKFCQVNKFWNKCIIKFWTVVNIDIRQLLFK